MSGLLAAGLEAGGRTKLERLELAAEKLHVVDSLSPLVAPVEDTHAEGVAITLCAESNVLGPNGDTGMKPLNDVFVRTTIQEKVNPMTTASSVPPVHAINVSSSAARTFGFVTTVMKFSSDGLKLPNPSITGFVVVRAPASSIARG
jgi:hypothetical protein